MKVFITGIAGFLGSHLAEAFAKRGDQVTGVDNLIGGYASNVPEGIRWVRSSCVDFACMLREMEGVDVVYHLAATAHEGLSVFSPAENWRHGPLACASVFSAACAARVKRIVFTSSMARYGNGDGKLPFTEETPTFPEDPYGIGKLASERLLVNLAETHDIEHVIAVPHNIYGPKQKYDDPFRNVVSIFANRVLQGKPPIIYGDGSQERCFSYVSDDVEPLVRMATDVKVVGEVINIGPDHEIVTILEVARLVCKALGAPCDPIFKPARPREVKLAHCSAEKARHLLGYAPVVRLYDGIERTAAWVRAQVPHGKKFEYHLPIEIDSPKVPGTWKEREM